MIIKELVRDVRLPETQEAWLALRTRDLTSTDMAALFGISPYMTEYELWYRKKSQDINELEENERMKWGNRLQDAIAAGICQDNGWAMLRRKDEYMRIAELRLGSSFDFEVNDGRIILEIKNVGVDAFSKGWLIDGDNIQAPPHIELQAQHQLLVDGKAQEVKIGALIGGNQVVLISRQPDEEVFKAIIEKSATFWKSIDAGISPAPNFVRDAEFIAKLYKYSEPGKVITATDRMADLAETYKIQKDIAKSAEDLAKGSKAELLTLIGDAEKVMGDGFSISAGMIGPKHIEYERAGYRDFRIYANKHKAITNAS